jgi:ribosome-associated protein
VQESTGLAQRKGRAYRELFQLVRQQLGGTGPAEDGEDEEDADE